MVTNCTFIDNSAKHYGGGMYNQNSSPTVTNCIFIGNSVLLYGGGIYNRSSSNPIVTNCAFTGNLASYGGGMFNYYSSPTVTNSSFSNNSTDRFGRGGGMQNTNSSPTVTGCTFTGNSAIIGGGIFNWSYSSPKVTHCIFTGNSADLGGGLTNDVHCSPTVNHCTFCGNLAGYKGGGIYNVWLSGPSVTHCIFSGNLAELGGGIYNFDLSSPTVTNCTFVGNTAVNGNGLACDSLSQARPNSVQMTNCILWDGGGEIWNNDDSTITIIYCDVQGGFPGLGNIDTDPNFVQPGYWDPNDTLDDPNDDIWVDGDYHLKSQVGRWDPNSRAWINDDITSRCIDTGNPGRLLGAEPTSPFNLRINMGAYGGTAQAGKTPMGWGMLADLTNDGLVNLVDYAWQVIDWQQVEDEQPGDLNRDSIVNLVDLFLLVEDFLLLTSWYEP